MYSNLLQNLNFNNTRYSDDIFNNDNLTSHTFIKDTYPPKLTLNKPNLDDKNAFFFSRFRLFFINNKVITKI